MNTITPSECRAARLRLGWSTIRMGAAVGVCADTVLRFERGFAIRPRTRAALRAVLQAAGAEFLSENLGGEPTPAKERPTE